MAHGAWAGSGGVMAAGQSVGPTPLVSIVRVARSATGTVVGWASAGDPSANRAAVTSVRGLRVLGPVTMYLRESPWAARTEPMTGEDTDAGIPVTGVPTRSMVRGARGLPSVKTEIHAGSTSCGVRDSSPRAMMTPERELSSIRCLAFPVMR